MPPAIKQHKPNRLTFKPDRVKCPQRTLKLNGAAWRRLRTLVLREQPICPLCAAEGRIEPSTDVHHVDDNAGNNQRSNLVAWCHSCHSKETRKNQLHGVR